MKFGHLEDGCLGAWDPETGTIWLAHGLTQTERRSTLAHEMVHAERGDEPCGYELADHKQERSVDRIASRRLIQLEHLAEALAWAQDEWEVAEALWVDVDTVRTRIEHLTEDERDHIERRIAAKGEVA